MTMSQAKLFVEHVTRRDPPDERMWRQFRFGDGSIAEYHPEGATALGRPEDTWVVVEDGDPRLTLRLV